MRRQLARSAAVASRLQAVAHRLTRRPPRPRSTLSDTVSSPKCCGSSVMCASPPPRDPLEPDGLHDLRRRSRRWRLGRRRDRRAVRPPDGVGGRRGRRPDTGSAPVERRQPRSRYRGVGADSAERSPAMIVRADSATDRGWTFGVRVLSRSRPTRGRARGSPHRGAERHRLRRPVPWRAAGAGRLAMVHAGWPRDLAGIGRASSAGQRQSWRRPSPVRRPSRGSPSGSVGREASELSGNSATAGRASDVRLTGGTGAGARRSERPLPAACARAPIGALERRIGSGSSVRWSATPCRTPVDLSRRDRAGSALSRCRIADLVRARRRTSANDAAPARLAGDRRA